MSATAMHDIALNRLRNINRQPQRTLVPSFSVNMKYGKAPQDVVGYN
jgi:hypothetical protein